MTTTYFSELFFCHVFLKRIQQRRSNEARLQFFDDVIIYNNHRNDWQDNNNMRDNNVSNNFNFMRTL